MVPGGASVHGSMYQSLQLKLASTSKDTGTCLGVTGSTQVLTHDDVALRKLHGLIRDSQHDTGPPNLQGGQVQSQRVLGTHSVNDAIQAATNGLSRHVHSLSTSRLSTIMVDYYCMSKDSDYCAEIDVFCGSGGGLWIR